MTACSGGGSGGSDGQGNPASSPPPPPPPPASYSLGGTVSGLNGSLVLQNNGGASLTVGSNGAFSFASSIAQGQSYLVSVLTQPPAQACTVSGGSGVMSANVTNVGVTCSAVAPPTYAIGGSVSGLLGTLVLRNNGADDFTVTANGNFTFAQRLQGAASYAVTIAQQPASQQCVVSSGMGAVGAADVASVGVQCTTLPPPRFSVGGNVSGLSGTVVLRNNAGNDLSISANGPFVFTGLLAASTSYSVTMHTQPADQSCVVTQGSGIMAAANVTNIAVSCSFRTYRIGGHVTGLTGTAVLQTNGGDERSVAANGSFEFPTELRAGQAYEVTVRTQPAAARCVIMRGTGTVATADVTSIDVKCRALKTSRYAYVLNTGYFLPPLYPDRPGSISQFTITADGTLAAMTPASVAVCDMPSGLVVEPSGKFLYVACPGRIEWYTNVRLPSSIAQFKIGADGALTPLSPAVLAVTGERRGLFMHPSGEFLYASGTDASQTVATRIWQYRIATAGQLVAMSPESIAVDAPSISVTLDSSGRNLYVMTRTDNYDENLLRYRVGTDGALQSPPTVEFPQPVMSSLTSLAVDPFERFLYVADHFIRNRIYTFELDADGHLVAEIVPNALPPSGGLALDPGGRYLYVASGGAISQFEVLTSGVLSALSPLFVSDASPTIDLSGRYVYATTGGSSLTDPSDDFILQYRIGSGGALVPLTPASLPSIATPGSMVTSP